jgi:hypothetical protein
MKTPRERGVFAALRQPAYVQMMLAELPQLSNHTREAVD